MPRVTEIKNKKSYARKRVVVVVVVQWFIRESWKRVRGRGSRTLALSLQRNLKLVALLHCPKTEPTTLPQQCLQFFTVCPRPANLRRKRIRGRRRREMIQEEEKKRLCKLEEV